MKIFGRLVFALLANALVLGGAAAGEGEASAGASQKDTATWLDIRASELLGKRVASPDGRALGTVEELVLDVRPEGVQYVVLSHDAGADDKLFVYPLNAFTRAEEKDRLVLHDVRRRNLRLSQGYDRGDWPFDPPLRRASELRGTQVSDPQGEAAGEEVVLRNGRR